MKLLKNATCRTMQNRIKVLEKDLEDQLHEVVSLKSIVKAKNVRIESLAVTNQLLEEIVEMADNQIEALKPKAEKWDAELKRQALKSKIARIKKMSAKQLATKFSGISIKYYDDVPAIICGYSENIIICACSHPEKSWTEKAIGDTDVILQNHEKYVSYAISKVKTQIINSLK